MDQHSGAFRLPIPTDDIIRMIEAEANDLDLYADLSENVDGCSDYFTDRNPDVKTSELLAPPRYENRLPMTLGHEYGHVRFHAPLWRKSGRGSERRPAARSWRCERHTIVTAPENDWMEWQAAYIGGALLMPRSYVIEWADEIARRACIFEQQRTLYIVLGLTGLRPSEALGLWWSDINFADSLIAVRRQLLEDGSVTDRLKTSRSRRDVVTLSPVREALLAQRACSGLLGKFAFVGRLGAPMKESTQGDNPWRRALTRAGVPYRTLYNLRHTYTTFMLSAGRPIQWIAHQLGHVGVRKIDEVYGRCVRTPADRMLHLGEFCRSISASSAKSRGASSQNLAKGKSENAASVQFYRANVPRPEQGEYQPQNPKQFKLVGLTSTGRH